LPKLAAAFFKPQVRWKDSVPLECV
jgi:hypothetical protein